MTEVHLSSRGRSLMPRVDLTPMVDLGFLLITFFMYTTTMIEPKVIDINMPVAGAPSAIPAESTISIIPGAAHVFFYYEGMLTNEAGIKQTDLKHLRAVIMHKQQTIKKLPARFSKEAHQLHVLIKPHDKSKYEDLIGLLDEMTINDVPYYTIGDLSKEERNLITGKGY